MDKNILKSILETDSLQFSREEIQSLLDEELEKEAEFMDTELIDMCIDVLESKKTFENKTTFSKKKIIRSSFVIAAVVGILACMIIAGTAKSSRFDIPSEYITKEGEFYRLNIPWRTETFIKIPANYENYVLPTFFVSDKCVLSQPSQEEQDTIIPFTVIDSDICGTVFIYDNTLYFDSSSERFVTQCVTTKTEGIGLLTNNGFNVLVISTGDGYTSISYSLYGMNYTVRLENCDYPEAMEIAKNFKGE